MFVIARHRLTASQPAVHPLEIFTSVELANLAFQLRATHRQAGHYSIPGQWPGYVHDDDENAAGEYRFAQADTTGFMAVWLYQGLGHFDSTLQPDELWYMEGGQAYRTRWLVLMRGAFQTDLKDFVRPETWPHTATALPQLDLAALEAARTHRSA